MKDTQSIERICGWLLSRVDSLEAIGRLPTSWTGRAIMAIRDQAERSLGCQVKEIADCNCLPLSYIDQAAASPSCHALVGLAKIVEVDR